MKKSAFTLIELLVVIAIIAVLAGIALPVFNKVLERAHVTQDGSNLRQLGIGTVAYLNDNNDTIFSNTTSVQAAGGNTLYAPGLLEINYVTNAAVFQSPFDHRLPATSPANISYGVNANILNRPATASAGSFDGNFATLVSASQLILYAPFYTGNPSIAASWTYLDNVANAQVPTGGTGMTVGTHQNGKWIDVLYADSHVSSIRFTDFQTKTDKSTANGINGLTQWYPLGKAAGP